MVVPDYGTTGYRDPDNMLMIYLKDPRSGAVLEGVHLRDAQSASFSLKDFKKARIDQQSRLYEGEGHKVAKKGGITIGGAKGNYRLTTCKVDGKDMEKHTAQYLKDGHRYLVVMWGEKDKTDKKVFDHAVKTFALAKP